MRYLAKAQRPHRAHVVLRKPAPSPSPPQQPGWCACNARGVTSARTCTTTLMQMAPRTLPQHTSEKCRTPRKSNRLAAALAGTRSAAQSEGMDRMSPRSSDTACRAYLSWKVSCQHRLTAIRQGGPEHDEQMGLSGMGQCSGLWHTSEVGFIQWDPMGLHSLACSPRLHTICNFTGMVNAGAPAPT